jgi:hypothetical protein
VSDDVVAFVSAEDAHFRHLVRLCARPGGNFPLWDSL